MDPQPSSTLQKETKPDTNGHEKKMEARTEKAKDSIWVVNERSRATVRSRFYKATLLAVSCAFQLTIVGEVLRMYGPVTFAAFTIGIVICAGIAAQEMGALLSAIDLRLGKLKDALFQEEEPPRARSRAKRQQRSKS